MVNTTGAEISGCSPHQCSFRSRNVPEVTSAFGGGEKGI